MRKQLHYSVLTVFLAIMIGFSILVTPSGSRAQKEPTAETGGKPLVYRTLYAAANQVGGKTATPPAESSPEKKQEGWPDGDGEEIAEKACQTCHMLTTVTDASKSLQGWRATVETMMDEGAKVPQDKVDTLVKYLAKNFGTPGAAPRAEDQTSVSSENASANPSPAAKTVELPDGDGKAIAMAYCQACHKLTNLLDAHKSLDDWRDTVQLMIDRGANVPPEKTDILVKYLVKNFGPKTDVPPVDAPPGDSPSMSPSNAQ